MALLEKVPLEDRGTILRILLKAHRSFREANPDQAEQIHIKTALGLGSIVLCNKADDRYYVVLAEVTNIAPKGVAPFYGLLTEHDIVKY
jgi:hypothetical protein